MSLLENFLCAMRETCLMYTYYTELSGPEKMYLFLWSSLDRAQAWDIPVKGSTAELQAQPLLVLRHSLTM